MSIEKLAYALGDDRFHGNERLAYLAIADNGGIISVPHVAKWMNCTDQEAFNCLNVFHKMGMFHEIPSGEYALSEIYDLGKPEPPQEKKKFQVPKWFRDAIYDRDGWACFYCGDPEDLTLDHVTPQSRGGDDSEENLVTCCRVCNSSKGDKTPEEWRQE